METIKERMFKSKEDGGRKQRYLIGGKMDEKCSKAAVEGDKGQ